MGRWLTTILFLSILILPQATQAQEFLSQLEKTGTEVYGTAEVADIYTTVGVIINSVLSILGVVFLIIIIYAGFLWMTAGGNTEQLGKAKKLLMNAAIGLVIALASYAIATFVIQSLQA